jgi:Fur family transcriptional regulator, ferric uptake regulator
MAVTRGATPPLSTPDVHTTAAQRLRADGQRYTGSRRALVDLLDAADRPLTIADLLERDRGLAQSSAYRNLAVLERAGVVNRLVTNDEYGRFELTEDLTEHHHHLICSSCGAMADFTISTQLEQALAKAFTKVAVDAGFHAEHHRLDLLGVCASCQ